MVKKKRKTTGKSAVTLSLTSQAIDRLAEMAQKSGFSRSAFVENLMAGAVAIAAPEAEKNLCVTVTQKADDEPQVQVSLAENTALSSAPAVFSDSVDSATLTEKITAQEKIIADLEAKLVAANAPRQETVVPAKSTGLTTAQTTKITALETQLKEQEAQLKKSTRAMQEMQQKLDRVALEKAALQQEIDKKDQILAQTKIDQAALTKGIEAEKAMVAQLQQQSNANAAAKVTEAELQETITALRQEKEQLQGQFQEATQAQASLGRKVTQLEEALKAAQADRTQALASLQQAYSDLKQQYKTQGDRLRILESKAHQTTAVTSVGEFYLNRWRKY
ncbi:ribbon-helix-helix protein [[Synechococcus] sp. NIES-970]|uniref:hypothetical protein n=1 Tax=Picosynechococcus sp. NKBG15041c TaxID=1407650 RepID=UPI0004263A59|nr:hypothetical protein [Picosynechococcus sp. NKBG15041c]BAW97418.1 ribbon-helix-helix protein [[Synechococcus] sp. NIES-970]